MPLYPGGKHENEASSQSEASYGSRRDDQWGLTRLRIFDLCTAKLGKSNVKGHFHTKESNLQTRAVFVLCTITEYRVGVWGSKKLRHQFLFRM